MRQFDTRHLGIVVTAALCSGCNGARIVAAEVEIGGDSGSGATTTGAGRAGAASSAAAAGATIGGASGVWGGGAAGAASSSGGTSALGGASGQSATGGAISTVPCPTCATAGTSAGTGGSNRGWAGAAGSPMSGGTAGASGIAGQGGRTTAGTAGIAGSAGSNAGRSGTAGGGGGSIEVPTVSCSDTPGPTYVAGAIMSDTAWCAANSPIIVTGNVIVFPGVNLVVRAGVRVKIQTSGAGGAAGASSSDPIGIAFNGGDLFVQGTASNQVLFTSGSTLPQPGDWNGLSFSGQAQIQMEYAIVEYAKTGIRGATLGVIRNSEIRQNGDGISAGSVTVDSSNIHDNVGFGVNVDTVIGSRIWGNDIGASYCDTIVDCVITGNRRIGAYYVLQTLRSTFISGNAVGFSDFLASPHVEMNTIVNNQVGVLISHPVRNNNICNNTEFDVKLTGSANTDVSNNYWCTMDTTQVSSKIQDMFDDLSLGVATYTPLRTASVPGAPAIPDQ